MTSTNSAEPFGLEDVLVASCFKCSKGTWLFFLVLTFGVVFIYDHLAQPFTYNSLLPYVLYSLSVFVIWFKATEFLEHFGYFALG